MNQKRSILAALIALTIAVGCAPSSETESDAGAATGAEAIEAQGGLFADAVIDEAVSGKWARSCVLCHVSGEGGAPRTGNRDEWKDRLAQGEDALLTHTIEGFNNMPPLGYCMSCETDDLRAMIKLMAGGGS